MVLCMVVLAVHNGTPQPPLLQNQVLLASSQEI
jgi:hypothetical protein